MSTEDPTTDGISTDASGEDEDSTLSVAAQMITDPDVSHEAVLAFERPGIHLELVDLTVAQPDSDDDWDLDPSADLGLRIMIAGMDPEVAEQLLRISADFLADASVEEDEE